MAKKINCDHEGRRRAQQARRIRERQEREAKGFIPPIGPAGLLRRQRERDPADSARRSRITKAWRRRDRKEWEARFLAQRAAERAAAPRTRRPISVMLTVLRAMAPGQWYDNGALAAFVPDATPSGFSRALFDLKLRGRLAVRDLPHPRNIRCYEYSITREGELYRAQRQKENPAAGAGLGLDVSGEVEHQSAGSQQADCE